MIRKDLINWLSLIVIQAANAATPLVIFPMALYVLGPNKYAALATTEAIAVFVIAITLYSFEIEGPARIINLDLSRDKSIIDRVYSEIFYARFVLFVMSSVSVVLLAWIISNSTTSTLLAAWMLLPLSYAIQPNWLFQAIEKNLVLATIVLLSRLSAVGVVVFFVKNTNEAIVIPLTIGVCYVTGSILALIYTKKKLKIQLQSPFKTRIFTTLRQGRDVFIGNLAVTLYRDMNTLILGIVGVGASNISIYSMAEKITKGMQAVMRPLTQLFFPKILRTLAHHPGADKKALRLLFPLLYPQLVFLCTFIVTALAFWFYLVPEKFKIEKWPLHESIILFVFLMVPGTFFGIANFVLGSAGLNFLGQKQYLRNSILITGLMNVFGCLILSKFYGATGAAIIFAIAEAFLMMLILRRYFNSSIDKSEEEINNIR